MDDSMAETAFTGLFAAHPAHAETIRGCMWMGRRPDGVDEFKHRHSRRGFTFDAGTGQVKGELDTGEPSDDADAVLRAVAEI